MHFVGRLRNSYATYRTLNSLVPVIRRFLSGQHTGTSSRGLRIGVLASNDVYRVHQTTAVVRAFEEEGHRAWTIPIQSLSNPDPEGKLHLGCELLRDCPDVLFHVNLPRRRVSSVIPASVPNLCYVEDLALSGIEQSEDDPGNNLTYFCSPEWYRRFREKMGVNRTGYLPPATDYGRYYDPAEPEYGCDVSYVGYFPNPHYHSREHAWSALSEHLFQRIQQEGAYTSDRGTAIRLLEEAEGRLGLRVHNRRDVFLKHLSERITRFALRACEKIGSGRRKSFKIGPKNGGLAIYSQTLRKLVVDHLLPLGIDLRLHGEGWGAVARYRPFTHPPIAPGPALANHYRTTRINIHANGDISMHGRVLECIAAGGFILVWATPWDFKPGGLNEHLEIGREVITFNSPGDLREKVVHFLAHPEERRGIVERGRARVLSEHTWTCRARQVVSDIARIRDKDTSA
jgi:hypothetical protein